MTLKPLFDKVILTQKKQEEKTASGIVLPGGEKDLPMQGTIVAVGPGGKVDGEDIKMEVKVGQKVLSIGNPFGFSNTLTQGIISRIDYVKNRFQTDAAINPGCSGGPILNSTGEVIGISQSIYNPDHNISNIGIGFAVPSNEAVKFIASQKR